MNRALTIIALAIALALPAEAAERITEAQIRQVIDITDTAARKRDAAEIGVYLSDDFIRVIEWQHKQWMAKVKIDKLEYLTLIDTGWAGIDGYDYTRSDIVIHVLPDGLSGMSYSTITEHTRVDGRDMTSRFREYATYTLEHGQPVITEISGHTLLGDTTPQ